MGHEEAPGPGRATLVALGLGMTFPTAMAWVYFIALGGTGAASPLQQVAYVAGKVVQFSIPIVFLVFIDRHWPAWRGPSARGLLLGAGLGLLVAAAMFAAYHGG